MGPGECPRPRAGAREPAARHELSTDAPTRNLIDNEMVTRVLSQVPVHGRSAEWQVGAYAERRLRTSAGEDRGPKVQG